MTGHELTTPMTVWSYTTLLPVLLLSPKSSRVVYSLLEISDERGASGLCGRSSRIIYPVGRGPVSRARYFSKAKEGARGSQRGPHRNAIIRGLHNHGACTTVDRLEWYTREGTGWG